MNSIVDQLRFWSKNNAAKLGDQGIELIAKFPDTGSDVPWKASIGLKHNEVWVSYTVWERTVFQTSLLVVKAKQTIVMDDQTPNSSEAVNHDLKEVVDKLLNGAYEKMN